MIGIFNGITGIRYGAECWCVQDVVNTERGELPDIRVSEATSFFVEVIGYPVYLTNSQKLSGVITLKIELG